jgi:hypothetical protein
MYAKRNTCWHLIPLCSPAGGGRCDHHQHLAGSNVNRKGRFTNKPWVSRGVVDLTTRIAAGGRQSAGISVGVFAAARPESQESRNAGDSWQPAQIVLILEHAETCTKVWCRQVDSLLDVQPVSPGQLHLEYEKGRDKPTTIDTFNLPF